MVAIEDAGKVVDVVPVLIGVQNGSPRRTRLVGESAITLEPAEREPGTAAYLDVLQVCEARHDLTPLLELGGAVPCLPSAFL